MILLSSSSLVESIELLIMSIIKLFVKTVQVGKERVYNQPAQMFEELMQNGLKKLVLQWENFKLNFFLLQLYKV